MRETTARQWLTVLLCTASFAASGLAQAPPHSMLEGEAALTIAGAHVWRGEIVSVEPVFQPSALLDFDPWSFTLWGSWELEHSEAYSQRSRFHATLDHLHESGEHIFRSGLTAFLYQNSFRHSLKNTVELFLGYTLDRALLPTLIAHYDIGHFNGLYVAGSASHRFELIPDAMALDIRANVGWGDRAYARDKFSLPRYTRERPEYEPSGAAFLDLTLRAEAPLRFSDRFKVVPGISFMRLLDTEIRNALRDSGLDADKTSGSLTLLLTF